MKRDSRISVALHLLLHMEELGEVVTSEALAARMGQNPVVLRRTMAGLRDAGIVRAEKGHGGGWALARPLADVSLRDVYDALGRPAIFRIGPRVESPGCLVERAVNEALGRAFGEAEALLLAELARVSVAALGAHVHLRGHGHAAAPSLRTKRTKKGASTHA